MDLLFSLDLRSSLSATVEDHLVSLMTNVCVNEDVAFLQSTLGLSHVTKHPSMRVAMQAAFHISCATGKIEAVKLLLTARCVDVAQKEWFGLRQAFQAGHWKTVIAILMLGKGKMPLYIRKEILENARAAGRQDVEVLV